jgi:hypothetical protein
MTFPDEISKQDMKTMLKELELAGELEEYIEKGKVSIYSSYHGIKGLAIRTPKVVVCYQKRWGKWHKVYWSRIKVHPVTGSHDPQIEADR